MVEEQGSERMWLDEACGLLQSMRAASRGRSDNERRGVGRTSGAWCRWRRARRSESGCRRGCWPDLEHGADDWGGQPDQDEAEELQGASHGILGVHR